MFQIKYIFIEDIFIKNNFDENPVYLIRDNCNAVYKSN